jgi:precorrin-4/cobalt-precorrin-4 C11-methyltransferase
VEKLLTGYTEDTPVAVVYKASWPQQKIIEGTLKDICTKMDKENFKRTALVAVGHFMGNKYELSKLYDSEFSHGFRGGVE